MRSSGRFWRDLGISVGILMLSFFAGLFLQQLCHSQSPVSMVFVLAVFLISLLTSGYLWGVLASLTSVLIVNYVFTFPYFAFDFLTTANLISDLVMLAVAVITGTLTTQIKQQERIKAENEKEKMRGNLLRAISHDLRTPLTTIYGSCSAIMENYDSLDREQQMTLLGRMREDADNLIRMVENLLSVTRVNGDDVRVNKTETVLEELIDAVLLKFHRRHPEQQVHVSIPEEFISIPMDAMLIEQVVINLLENTVFHAKGMTELSLEVCVRGGDAVFSVLDNGCGIPKDRMGDLFSGQLYTRSTPTDAGRNSMGIGLPVCAAIIKAHGGEIWAENRETGGACFRFRLEMEKEYEQ